jgi:hypothetical protein
MGTTTTPEYSSISRDRPGLKILEETTSIGDEDAARGKIISHKRPCPNAFSAFIIWIIIAD